MSVAACVGGSPTTPPRSSLLEQVAPRGRRGAQAGPVRGRLRARHRGDRDRHLQPGRDLRRRRPVPRLGRGAVPAAVERSGKSTEAMLPHLYVHYDDGAVSHLFQVAAGLDSMAVGEGQILGQTRDALRLGQELGTVGPALNVLFQQALRVGKRSRAETDIDSAAPTLVGAALDRAARHGGDVARPAGRRGRRRRHGRAGHRHRLAPRRRRGRRGQPHPRARRAAGRGVRRPGGRARPTCPPSSPRPTWSSPAPAPPGCWSPAAMVEAARTDGRPMVFVDLALPARRRPRRSPSSTASPGSTWPTWPRSSRPPTPAARSPRCAGSSPRRSRRSSPPAAPRASRRPSSRSARWPPRSSTPRWSGSTTGCPT